jgi:hypothetical protein
MKGVPTIKHNVTFSSSAHVGICVALLRLGMAVGHGSRGDRGYHERYPYEKELP